jgi:hypothetical protein
MNSKRELLVAALMSFANAFAALAAALAPDRMKRTNVPPN